MDFHPAAINRQTIRHARSYPGSVFGPSSGPQLRRIRGWKDMPVFLRNLESQMKKRRWTKRKRWHRKQLISCRRPSTETGVIPRATGDTGQNGERTCRAGRRQLLRVSRTKLGIKRRREINLGVKVFLALRYGYACRHHRRDRHAWKEKVF